MDAGADLTQICSKTDNGSGVALGDCFAIYTVAIKPDREFDLPELSNKVTQLQGILEILNSKDDLKGRTIRPFGNAGEGTRFEFLRNARRAKKHCIVGSGEPVDCLLALLRRPWCLLEICCLSDALAIQLIAECAAIAERLPGQKLAFEGATILLSYELRARSQLAPIRHEGVATSPALASRNLPVLMRLSTSLFAQSEKSYRKDILRMMYVYAIHSGTSIRDALQAQLLDSDFTFSTSSGCGATAFLHYPTETLNSESQSRKVHDRLEKRPIDRIRDSFRTAVWQMCEIIR